MLIGNGVRFHGSPLVVLGGNTLASITRERWGGGNRGFEDAMGEPLAARPGGSYPPVSWLMPRRAGSVASYGGITGAGALTGHAAAGLAASADLTGTGALAAAGSLIVSAVAALQGSGALTADVNAILQASAALAGAGALTASVRALGRAVAAITGTGTLAGTAKAIGYASADLTVQVAQTEAPTPAQIAAEVWSTVAASFNTAGTMGEALNVAQIMLRNKTITDPAAGTITVYDSDGTTVLYVADLFADAAGTNPYTGAGAERRERLE